MTTDPSTPDPAATSDATGLREAVEALHAELSAFDALDGAIPSHVDVPDDYEAGIVHAAGRLGSILAAHTTPDTAGLTPEQRLLRDIFGKPPTPDASPDPAVVQVLAAHARCYSTFWARRWNFVCGASIKATDVRGETDAHRAHVAQALAAAGFGDVRAVEAERDGWEESSANWQQLHNNQHDRRKAAEKELAGLVAKIEALAHSPETDKYRDEACRGVVALPYASNRYVRLLDDLRALIPADAATALDAVREEAKAEERERIAQAIEAKYLGPDSGRGYDGREAPDAHCRNAYDEGLETAASIARHTPEATT